MISFEVFNSLVRGCVIQSMQTGDRKYEVIKPSFLKTIKGEKRRVIFVKCLNDAKQGRLFLRFDQMSFFTFDSCEDMENDLLHCKPGYLAPCDCGEGHDFHIQGDKP